MSFPRIVAILFLSVVIAFATVPHSYSAVFHVTKGDDTNDGDCSADDCSLREAIIAANEAPDADTIHIPAGGYYILKPGHEDACASGDLDITGPLTLVGEGMRDTWITALGDLGVKDRVFHILAPGHDVRFENIGIVGGFKTGFNSGGGVFVESAHDAYFLRCLFFRNLAFSGGGIGVGNDVDETHIVECVIEKNESPFGGGILARSSVGIHRSTVADNDAYMGGGIYADTTFVIIVNSTFYKNSADDYGSEMLLDGSYVSMRHSTLVAADAFTPATPSIQLQDSSLWLHNNILWGSCNTSGGGIDSEGRNMGDPTMTCSCDDSTDLIINTDPLLRSLGQYGGPTPTAPPWGKSPAIDPYLAIDDPPATDQRGVSRPQEGDGFGGPNYDIGAVECRRLFIKDLLPRIHFTNISQNACSSYKDGVLGRGRIKLYISEQGYEKPKLWGSLDFGESLEPGQRRDFYFGWPEGDFQPSDNATIYFSYETDITVEESDVALEAGFVPPDPPDRQPPEPTPSPKPVKRSYPVFAFPRGKPRPSMGDRPPYLRLDLSNDHRVEDYPLYGPDCADTPVGVATFILEPDMGQR
ncbi:MAG: CSLREA domain-containing protein [Deltaproteobacteria bacterium]|nr:CSLREA domain-containing protein [Deltaproteobacteria bacterium]